MTLPPRKKTPRNEFLGTGRAPKRGRDTVLGAKSKPKAKDNTNNPFTPTGGVINNGVFPKPGAGVSDVLNDIRVDESLISDILGGKITNIPVADRTPAMLMPLRLEYRFVEVVSRNLLKNISEFKPVIPNTPPGLSSGINDRKAQERVVEEIQKRFGKSPLGAQSVTAFLEGRGQDLTEKTARDVKSAITHALEAGNNFKPEIFETHLLLRWYPDENFATKGVAPESPQETASRLKLVQNINTTPWWRAAQSDDPALSGAWQHYVAEIGDVARAIHLLRSAGLQTPDPDWENKIGRITALPSAVALYTVAQNGNINHLATGNPIPQNTKNTRSPVSYTPEVLGTDDEPDTWLSNFPTAIKMGMGLRIDDAKKIAQAKNAQWLIAVGLHRGENGKGAPEVSPTEIEDMLRSRIANGEVAILPQDSNTNNTANAPTSYRRFETDPKEAAQSASAQERGAFSGGKIRSADLVSEILGLDPAILRSAIKADDQGFADAQAMLRVIGPALIDDALDGVTLFKGIREDELIEVLAAGVFARGALPAMRFGSSAYGLLPVSDILKSNEAKDGRFAKEQQKVFGFIGTIARVGRVLLPDYAQNVVPVIKPDDKNAGEAFETLIKQNRVATRIEVNDPLKDGTKPKAITCPYVRGKGKNRQPETYLHNLRILPQDKLVDPTRNDPSWPLLYRLARMTLTRQTVLAVAHAQDAGFSSLGALMRRDKSARSLLKESRNIVNNFSAEALTKGALLQESAVLKPEVSNLIRRLNRNYASALAHLAEVAKRPDGTAQLEVLMLEVIDLFQHRFDAFATGLAYITLATDRQNGTKGLAKGWYGFLGKLRQPSQTGGSDGYILAPSTPQAVTAAVMRAAHLRHKAGNAFEIDLSSRRVRGALKLLDTLSRGHTLNEALGMRGERYLHRAKKDVHILPLRVRYPIKGRGQKGHAFARVFDGLAFLDDTGTQPDADVAKMHAQLTDELDALSDVIMAEATHQRAMGAAETANAWLKVMSGGSIPGRPQFLRTQRTGHNSTHKASYMRNASSPTIGDTPREIAEPLAAALARELLSGFDSAAIEIEVNQTTDGTPAPRLSVSLEDDLKMRPIDLVIGGASEVQVRAKTHVIRLFLETPGVLAATGALADGAQFASNLAGLSIHTTQLDPLLSRAAQLRKTLQEARPLRAGDLNAMAPASQGLLSEAQEITCIETAIAALDLRLQQLEQHLGQHLSLARTANDMYLNALDHARSLQENPAASPQMINTAIANAETKRRDTMERAAPLAVYAEPSLLRVVLLDEALADPLARIETPMNRIFDRLDARQARLHAAMAGTNRGFDDLAAAEMALRLRVEALQNALDGDALPVFPPLPRNAANLRAEFAPPLPLSTALNDWGLARAKLANFRDLFATAPDTQVRPVSFQATNDDAHDPANDASAPPRAQHFEHIWGRTDALNSNHDVAGFVADEWSDSRPSPIQNAGLAINYDSPQSEPPHCLLLCVPDPDNLSVWNEDKAARSVFEAINWMRIRALSASQRVIPTTLFPNANQVASKTGKASGHRIPDQPVTNVVSWEHGAASVKLVKRDQLNLINGSLSANIIERLGFRPTLE